MHIPTIQQQAPHTRVKLSQIYTPGTRLADLTPKLQALMLASMKKSGKPHGRLAEELSVAVGHKVSARMLYRFTAPSAQANFPAAWVAGFCEVTGDDSLKRLMLGPELLEMLELGEHAAVILDAHARRKLLGGVRSSKAKENGNGSCDR